MFVSAARQTTANADSDIPLRRFGTEEGGRDAKFSQVHAEELGKPRKQSSDITPLFFYYKQKRRGTVKETEAWLKSRGESF